MKQKISRKDLESRILPKLSQENQLFKQNLSSLLSLNFWRKNEHDVLALFKDIQSNIWDRNRNILSFLSEYWFDYYKQMDISWWLFIWKEQISDIEDVEIRSFFLNWKYTRISENRIYSRWYWYYFNLKWFKKKSDKEFQFDSKEYFWSLVDYQNTVINLLNKYKWKDINEINWLDKTIFLVLLDHYKNICLFLLNILINIKDKNKIMQILNLKEQTYNRFFSDNKILDWIDIDSIIQDLIWNIEATVNIFNDMFLNISSKWKIKLFKPILNNNLFNVLWDYFDYFNKLSQNTNDELKQNYFSKLSKKLVFNLIRIFREQDNPLKMLLSCNNIASWMQDTDKKNNISIVWALYWWIEMPFYMKYILEKHWFDEDKLIIDLTTVSSYHIRNNKAISTSWDYPNSSDFIAENIVVLDDNIWNWGTMQNLINFLSTSWRVIESGVAEIWLRRNSLWELSDPTKLSFLLSKVPNVATPSPIHKKSNNYRTLVVKYLKKVLPWLVWKL